MKKNLAVLFLVIFYSCAEKPVIKPGFDFSQVKTIIVYPTPDFKSFPGSGMIINKNIVYHLMKMGINVVERESTPALMEEVALNQSGMTNFSLDVNLISSDVVLLCTLTDFKDYKVIVMPIVTENKGSIITTMKTVDEPVISKEVDGVEKVYFETTTTETITTDEGSIIETERIEYVPSRVGVSIQLLNASDGDVLWTNTYWYSSLSVSYAVNECVNGAFKPLRKLLK